MVDLLDIIQRQKKSIDAGLEKDIKENKDNPFIMASNIPIKHISILLEIIEDHEKRIQKLEKNFK